MSFSIHFQGEELYITAPSYRGMTGEGGLSFGMGSTTVSLTHLLRTIVREEIETAMERQFAASNSEERK